MDSVVLLSGGTGGAKLARGLADVCDDLTVVAQHRRRRGRLRRPRLPRPGPRDLLAGRRDRRARLGPPRRHLAGDGRARAAAGRPHWFRLGDRDLAMCLIRTERLRAGASLTEAHAAVVEALGVEARVLPMSDEPVATWVHHRRPRAAVPGVHDRRARRGTDRGRRARGDSSAPGRPTRCCRRVAEADAIVIGPSNPVISIGPILALPGMREALRGAPAPVVAVSPFVGGRSRQGPDATRSATRPGIERSAAGHRARLRGRDRRHRRRRAGRRTARARDRHA